MLTGSTALQPATKGGTGRVSVELSPDLAAVHTFALTFLGCNFDGFRGPTQLQFSDAAGSRARLVVIRRTAKALIYSGQGILQIDDFKWIYVVNATLALPGKTMQGMASVTQTKLVKNDIVNSPNCRSSFTFTARPSGP